MPFAVKYYRNSTSTDTNTPISTSKVKVLLKNKPTVSSNKNTPTSVLQWTTSLVGILSIFC